MSEKNTEDMLQAHISAEPQRLGDTIYFHKPIAKRITCKDGTTLSVQASEHHYCAPRINLGPYFQVEVGYPSISPPEAWMDYCEDRDTPTDTVYGYVPIDLVAEFIDAHGGINFDAMKPEAA